MAMSPDALVSVVGAVVAGGCTIWTARAAKRTPPQEKRDDFATVTERMDKELARQGGEIRALRERADKAEKRVEGASVAITYLIDRVRGLHGYIRSQGMEPPAAKPVPETAREFINHDV